MEYKKKNAEGMRGSRSAVRNLGQNHTHMGATFVRLCLGQTAFRYGYKDPVMSHTITSDILHFFLCDYSS